MSGRTAPARRAPRAVATIGLVACLGLTSAVRAQSSEPPPAPPPAPEEGAPRDVTAASQPQVLVVLVSVHGSEVDPLAVLEAVGRELGVPVVPSPVEDPALGTLRVRIGGERIAMSYQAPKGTEISRSVGAPASPPRAVETTALLAGNLVRDQASGLLASLQAKLQAERVAAWSSAVASGATSIRTITAALGRDLRAAVAKQPSSLGEGTTEASPPEPRASDPQPDPLGAAPANLSLVHPVAIFPDSDERFVCLELGMVYSYVGAVYGLSVSGVVTRVARQVYGTAIHGAWGHHHGAVHGVDISGVGLYVDGPERGLIVSGAVHLSSGDLAGVRMTGAVDVTEGEMLGVQVTGGVNVVGGAVAGLQIAGVLNSSDAEVYGLQAAGGVSVASGRLEGIQLSGAASAARELAGLQVAGGVNVADAVEGVQLGPVNVARRVEGVQIGVINVAEHVDGTAIGLLSIADNGRLSAVAWASSRTLGSVGVQSTVGPIYTLWGVGMHPGADQVDYIVEPTFALGGHIAIDDFFIDQDIGYAWRVHFEDGESHDQRDVFRYRAMAGWRIIDPFAIFLGGGLWTEFGEGNVGPEVLGGIQVF